MSPKRYISPWLRTTALGDPSSKPVPSLRIRGRRTQYGEISSYWNWNVKLGLDLQQELLYKVAVGSLASLL